MKVIIELFPTDVLVGWLSNQNEQRALVSHGPLRTHVTNLFVSVISRTGNSFGLSRSVIKPILTQKLSRFNWSPNKSESGSKTKYGQNVCFHWSWPCLLCPLAAACPLPLPPPLHHCLPLLMLQAPHWHHSDHRVLMKFALAIHQAICLGSFYPHALIHLPRHGRVERSKYFH